MDVQTRSVGRVASKRLVKENSFSWKSLPALKQHGSFRNIERILGDGPMRFAPKRKERKIKRQVRELSESQKQMFVAMKEKFQKKAEKKGPPKTVIPCDAHALRYARANSFKLKQSWKVFRHYGRSDVQHLLTLKASEIEEQLRSKTLFPLPGLQCRGGNDVFYMKPSRFNPRKTSTDLVIDNLAYVINCMLEQETNSKSGIAFLANMNDWTFENFSTEYCRKFMEILQGVYFPVHVSLFLIVNPPNWFDKVWTIMRPMLSKEFRQRVHVIPESDLFEFLPFHYEAHLPDEMETGTVPTRQLVEDFVTYRLYIERGTRRRRSDTQLTNSGSSQDLSDVSGLPLGGAPSSNLGQTIRKATEMRSLRKLVRRKPTTTDRTTIGSTTFSGS